jgi:hypothetical protein
MALMAGTALLALAALAPATVMAATEQQKVDAINSGLGYLATQQLADGSWDYSGYNQAATGAVIGAFMSQQGQWGTNAAAYQTIVNNGMNYLLNELPAQYRVDHHRRRQG